MHGIDPAAQAILVRNAPRWRGRRVGLLGGSFNPAHAGHVHISVQALARLGLDAVWWLVSPQNPLKARAGMAPIDARLAAARAAERHPRIVPTTIETDLQTAYTADTLQALKRLHPNTQFIWLMGEDNLLGFHRWDRWADILRMVPIAVFARPGYHEYRWTAPALSRLRRFMHRQATARGWPDWSLPALVLLDHPLHSASATAIRQREPDWAAAFSGPAGQPAALRPMERSAALQETIGLPVSQAAPSSATPAPTPVGGASDPDSRLLHTAILQSLDDDKAEEIVSIPLAGKSTIADYMVIASGRSTRQVAAMAQHLAERLKRDLGVNVRIEGLQTADWVLIDAGDAIVHLFRPEVRSFYGLEKMWSIEVPAAHAS